MNDKQPTAKQWKSMLEKLLSQAPEGFEKSVSKTSYGRGNESTVLTLKNDDGVEIIVSVSDSPDRYIFGVGTTNFSTKLGQRTFDRLGVDSSFYLDSPEDLQKVVDEQLKRVAESRERIARSEPVPGLPGGFSVTPERKLQVTEALRSGKGYAFTPAGFGTGYHLSLRRRDRYSERAKPETAKFFGFQELYFDRMDCD